MASDASLILATLPLAGASLVHQRAQPSLPPPDPAEQWWRDFCAVAPSALIQYVQLVDDEVQADPSATSDIDAWFSRRHPSEKIAIEALHDAFHGRIEPRLPYVQGAVVQWAEWRLGHWLALDRAAGRTGAVYDHVICDVAAQQLLGWSNADSHAAWNKPLQFLEQWRRYGTDDAATLERAGLHSAECWFLGEDDGYELSG